MNNHSPLVVEGFPRANQYNPDWLVAATSGGANPLWLAEWLASKMDLAAGMRVLDLACGRAASSIFLHREFGVTVWATDLWFSASENLQRIRDAGVEHGVFPLNADARRLPFANEFFDAIVCIDAWPYFGTDDHYLKNLARLVRPGGLMAIAGAGMIDELSEPLPQHLQAWWASEPDLWCIHSPAWWRRHWEKTGIVDVLQADTMPDGWRRWIDWHQLVAPDNLPEIQSVEADRGRHLGYVRVIARRRQDHQAVDPVIQVPPNYISKPLLRS